jgi:tellurite resistance protein TehA-like permease
MFIGDFFGLFRFVLTKFCLFRLFRYRSETPKQTEKNVFWFRDPTNRKTTKTD